VSLQFGGAGRTEHVKPAAVTKFTIAALEGIGIFAIFMLFFGYFIVFEWPIGGRTPGKRLLGIRVVRDGGFALDFTSAVVRNVVRMLEFGVGFYAISAAATLLSPMNRRLGDMAAGTLVVRENRFERTPTLAEITDRSAGEASRTYDLSEPEWELVRRYVERRPSLTKKARATLAKSIAGKIRPKLDAALEPLGDEDLLVRVAADAP